MVGYTQLFVFSVLVVNSVFGDGENNGKSQFNEDLKKGNTRTDAEQDPYTSVTLAGDANSTLFASCLAASRTIQARFASIEVVPGSEYIRYVPDSSQLSCPISWKSVTGNFLSILDCAKAAHDGGWSMFKYNGVKCEVVNTTYILKDVTKCEENDSDAVFILVLPAAAIKDCPKTKFLVGLNAKGAEVYGLVSTTLRTYMEARFYCKEFLPNDEMTLFVNEHPPLTVQTVINNLTALGCTKTNLWVNADGEYNAPGYWYGNFAGTDWWNGRFPAVNDPIGPSRAGYMDKDASFKLRGADKSFKAGALCITFAISDYIIPL